MFYFTGPPLKAKFPLIEWNVHYLSETNPESYFGDCPSSPPNCGQLRIV